MFYYVVPHFLRRFVLLVTRADKRLHKTAESPEKKEGISSDMIL